MLTFCVYAPVCCAVIVGGSDHRLSFIALQNEPNLCTSVQQKWRVYDEEKTLKRRAGSTAAERARTRARGHECLRVHISAQPRGGLYLAFVGT